MKEFRRLLRQLCLTIRHFNFSSLCCPYGPLTVFAALFGFVAMVLTYSAAFGCSLFEATSSNQQNEGSYGLWSMQGIAFNSVNGNSLDNYACYSYDSIVPFGDVRAYLDGPMKAGRAFAAMTAIVAAPLWITIMMLCCVSFGYVREVFQILMLLCVFVGTAILLELVRATWKDGRPKYP
jgi:hypothetical protein